MKLTWEYIAGFFDGEGSLYLTHNLNKRNRAFMLSIAQSGRRGLVILSFIKEFLAVRDIRSTIGCTAIGGKRKAAAYRLLIAERLSLTRFLQEMVPRTSVKKTECQDALRNLVLFPSLRRSPRNGGLVPVDEIKKILVRERSAIDVAKEFGVTMSDLKPRIDRWQSARWPVKMMYDSQERKIHAM